MRVLLVEPTYMRRQPRKKTRGKKGKKKSSAQLSDESLWYPPLGLMKLARFHLNRGDQVHFAVGCEKRIKAPTLIFDDTDEIPELWDRIYISTLFTYHFKNVVDTVNFYKDAVGGTVSRIYVGGVMASLMAEDIYEETGVMPITSILESSKGIGFNEDVSIDNLPPLYSIEGISKGNIGLSGELYAINDTYYAYTTRGCPMGCPWCGVPKIEPTYIPYIDIKSVITKLRNQYGDKSRLLLMDNNILVSTKLKKIVEDLVYLGYGRGELTNTQPPKQRVVDFNQGLDASLLTEEKMQLLSRINLEPMRIAFDSYWKEREHYVRAVRLANKYKVKEFSNYMLFNFKDTPRDLYFRFLTNFSLNLEMADSTVYKPYRYKNKLGIYQAPSSHIMMKRKSNKRKSLFVGNPNRLVSRGKPMRKSYNNFPTGRSQAESKVGKIYSYPMRYAPINEELGIHANRKRDYFQTIPVESRDWLRDPAWTKRFVRSIEVMKGAAFGAISPTHDFARRAIGEDFTTYILNLYMPEALLRYRHKHEKRYDLKATGLIEEFKEFLIGLLNDQASERFKFFHKAVSDNSSKIVKEYIAKCKDQEIKKWLELYLVK